MGFEKTNKIINARIQEIALKFENNVTEREKNELATLIYPKLKYHIWKICKNQDDTEEALQWSLKKIFKCLDKYDASSGYKFTTWSYAIARNETLYYLHMKGKHRMQSSDDLVYEKGESHNFTNLNNFEEDFNDLYNLTIEEINGIDDSLLKNIAIDKMIKSEKVKVIAERYSINENTVKTKLRKIRSDIKSKVLEKNPEIAEKLNHIFDI
jgi:RNA polymerase sigma factor (sigma-70 family)